MAAFFRDRTDAVVRRAGRRSTAELYSGAVVQLVMNRVQSQFQTVRDTEFVENIVQMVLDGLLTDEQPFRHILVLEALSDQPDDFTLARAQRRALLTKA